ncbi:Crossover junction endodeoxyribonuclease RusA [Pirellula sp. SH-Sr6A]|uniref:RusA family crossover junction endodeoxyribonuclease n=1 Tax=Pirellula sp. SH-Sr6A TaxID=1632865 RepID=UPI00078DBC16|nr:RusA family crossover junction endodeoxyribonuclease [Pirellula sp. SH-Sr6A]AMV31686.1 Crossover junction endodeoxyribonuclease RusA [Pirellula sp. SH-Sr6A]
MVTELTLPYPPSINHYFSYYQGRPVLSKDARTYRHQVRRMAIAAGIKPLMGPLAIRIDITPPDDRRRDADNVQKSVLDALQHAGAFWDDSQVVWLLSIKHEAQKSGTIRVQLSDETSQSLSPSMEIA